MPLGTSSLAAQLPAPDVTILSSFKARRPRSASLTEELALAVQICDHTGTRVSAITILRHAQSVCFSAWKGCQQACPGVALSTAANTARLIDTTGFLARPEAVSVCSPPLAVAFLAAPPRSPRLLFLRWFVGSSRRHVATTRSVDAAGRHSMRSVHIQYLQILHTGDVIDDCTHAWIGTTMHGNHDDDHAFPYEAHSRTQCSIDCTACKCLKECMACSSTAPAPLYMHRLQLPDETELDFEQELLLPRNSFVCSCVVRSFLHSFVVMMSEAAACGTHVCRVGRMAPWLRGRQTTDVYKYLPAVDIALQRRTIAKSRSRKLNGVRLKPPGNPTEDARAVPAALISV